MNLLHIVILSIVEGITEFLPVSSTFHLILTSKILGLPQNDFWKMFEVVIQSGAILAVFLLYWRDLWKDRKLLKNVLISFIPTAVIGFALYKIIKGIFFEANLLMSVVFVVIGLAFLVTERLVANDQMELKHELKSLTWTHAIIVGLVQALAVVPGVSRAGSVMLAMMFMQYRRDESAKYSFYLSIPTIFAASALDIFKMRDLLVSHTDYLSYLALGFMVTFAAAFIVVKWLLTYLKTHTLDIFGWYRLAVFAVIVLTSALHIFNFL